MNPSIEVQITARLDKLDAGLRLAEAKVMSSTTSMGNAGEKAGASYGDKFSGMLAARLGPALLIATGIKVLGDGINNALKAVTAGASGNEIGLALVKGMVEGAKTIPVVGPIVNLIDHIVNYADIAASALEERIAKVGEALAEKARMAAESVMKFEDLAEMARDRIMAEKSPEAAAQVAPKAEVRAITKASEESISKVTDEAKARKDAIEAEIHDRSRLTDEQLRLEDEASQASRELGRGVLSARVQALRDQQKAIDDLAKEEINKIRAQEQEIVDIITQNTANKVRQVQADEAQKIAKEAQDKIDKDQADAVEKRAEKERKIKEAEKQKIKEQEEAQKKELDRALQAQQDIIDANTQAQDKIDKVGRLDRMAQDAGQGLISSGQTALGQFNFAQDGASGQALALAQKQVTALEAIEKATAEQVRLTKGGQEFR